MKTFIVKCYGKRKKLQLAETAEPVVKENALLVQVYAAGVNLLAMKIIAKTPLHRPPKR